MKITLTPIQQERLNDLRELANHDGRDQWHGLRCHHIDRGQFTATYSDIAARWGVTASVVYSTIKRFIKLGLITAQRFERATLFTITQPSDKSDKSDPSEFKNFKELKKKKSLRFSRRKYKATYLKKLKRRYRGST